MNSAQQFLTFELPKDQDFYLDSKRRTVCSPKGKVRLRPKLWNVLAIFLHNENQLIAREVLIDNVWRGNHFTGPQAVSHSICVLRSIINKLDLPLIIITLPKRGYIMQKAMITEPNSITDEFDIIRFDQSYG